MFRCLSYILDKTKKEFEFPRIHRIGIAGCEERRVVAGTELESQSCGSRHLSLLLLLLLCMHGMLLLLLLFVEGGTAPTVEAAYFWRVAAGVTLHLIRRDAAPGSCCALCAAAP